MVLRPRGGRWGEECGGMAHARAGGPTAGRGPRPVGTGGVGRRRAVGMNKGGKQGANRWAPWIQ
jgi:hypothetical protein